MKTTTRYWPGQDLVSNYRADVGPTTYFRLRAWGSFMRHGRLKGDDKNLGTFRLNAPLDSARLASNKGSAPDFPPGGS